MRGDFASRRSGHAHESPCAPARPRRQMADQNASQPPGRRRIATLLADRRDEILNLWIKERLEADEFRDELISKKDLRRQSQQVLDMLVQGVRDSGGADFEHAAFDDLRSYLNE